jgi:aspartate kinase
MRKVMKFGGTSVKDAAMMRRVVEIVTKERSDGHEVVCVASAVSGVTNALVRAVSPPPAEHQVDEHVDALTRQHHAIAREFLPNPQQQAAAVADLDKHLARLRKVLQGAAYTEELTPRAKDLVLSFGERLSCTLLAHGFLARGTPAVLLESDTIGMITDGRFGQASPILSKISHNFQTSVVPHLRGGRVAVITGYFGCDEQLRTTTFGRGGSDYAAAIVANAVDADVCEIWTDVDGFLTCDPRMIPEAELIQQTSYEAAAELAYFGAKVLHARTVEPVEEVEIPIRIKNTFNPQAEGTWILEGARETGKVFTAIAYKDKLSSLRLYGPGLSFAPEIAARIVGVIAALDVNLYSLSTSASNFAMLVDQPEAERVERALQALKGGVVENVFRTDDLALICCVGDRMASTPGIAARVFGAIGRAGINIEMISEGSSPVAVNFAVRGEALESAVRVLHKEFFAGPKGG